MLKFNLFTCTLLLLIFSSINGYYLSLDTNEEQCFFERVVEKSLISIVFEVADGGFLDIDYKIVDPSNVVVAKGERESSDRHTITAQHSGKYSICFFNILSSKTPKILYFSIYVEEPHIINDQKSTNGSTIDPVIQKTENMMQELVSSLVSVQREQEYMVIRNKVHYNINKNTDSRVILWAIIEVILLLTITFGQIFYLKKFFEVKRFV